MKQITFQLEDQAYIQLNNLLKILRLVGTGGEANIRIDDGEVQVNGAIETQKRKKLRVGDQIIYGKVTITVQ